MFSSSELYMSKRFLHNFPSLKRLYRDLMLQCGTEKKKQALPSKTHKASFPMISFVVLHICNYYCCFDFICEKFTT
jgi:hypothetical protein